MIGQRWLIIFSFVYLPLSTIAAVETVDPMLKRVYRKLQHALGDQRIDWPRLEVIGVKNRGAVYLSKRNTMLIDQLLIDECLTYGDRAEDALAFILAHEITHFYQAHEWVESGFLGGFGVNLQDSSLRKQQEKQADIFGSFIARQAGYNVFTIAEDLMHGIYSAYGLSTEENTNYPTLKERLLLTAEACTLASMLYEAYTMGNYALVAGQYQVAHGLFEFVQNHIQFKELEHNIGMVYLGMLFSRNKPKLHYVLPIDHNHPILRTSRELASDDLFRLALEKFWTVLDAYDNSYNPSQSALICLHAIQHKEIADSLWYIKDQDLPTSARLNLANYYHNRNERKRADALYNLIQTEEDAPAYVKQMAAINMKGAYQDEGGSKKRMMISLEENIDGIASIVLIDDLDNRLKIEHNMEFAIQQENNSVLSQFIDNDRISTLQRVYDAAAISSKSIRVGSTFNAVKQAYPSINVCHSTLDEGFWAIVEKSGLLFRFSAQAIVEEWGVFAY